MEGNVREKFQALNRVGLTDSEFQRLLDDIVTPDVYAAAHPLRNRNAVGTSSGLNIAAAVTLAGELGPGKVVATVAVDTGLKYLAGDLFTE